jgi:hypothetical protein
LKSGSLLAFGKVKDMNILRTKLIAATAVLVVAAAPVFAAEASRGSEGNGETPRSAPGARTLSERGINFLPRIEGDLATRAFPADPATMERNYGTLGRKASGETFAIPASEELKRAL